MLKPHHQAADHGLEEDTMFRNVVVAQAVGSRSASYYVQLIPALPVADMRQFKAA